MSYYFLHLVNNLLEIYNLNNFGLFFVVYDVSFIFNDSHYQKLIVNFFKIVIVNEIFFIDYYMSVFMD